MIDLNAGISIAGFIGVLGFLWKTSGDLRKELSDVNKRVARIEGLLEGLGLAGKLPKTDDGQ